MHKYEGLFRYSNPESYRLGGPATIALTAILFGPYLSVSITDPRWNSIHTSANARFDFKARDSPSDMTNRDAWKADWYDSFRGRALLIQHHVAGAPRTLDIMAIASWRQAFCVVEFSVGGDYCQFATRPRPGSPGV